MNNFIDAERILLSSPDVGENEEQAVLNAVRSGWIAPLGPDVDAFEFELAQQVNVKHAIALSSGTAALHLALLSIGVGPGDVVLTSTMTFAATANAIMYTGAEPYFIDSLPATGNIDPDLVEQVINDLAGAGERVKAILPVDLLGKAADYTRLESIAHKYGLPIIADAAESLGASHRGKRAGNFGIASALSFNGNKIMTTSGGGALLTNDDDVAARVRYLSTQARQPVVHYEHVDIGYNYRLSNILAALGRAQLDRLDEMIDRRRAIRRQYEEFFAPIEGVEIFGGADDDTDNFWLTSILVDEEVTSWSTSDLSSALSEENIESRPLWKPMHMQPVFAGARSRTTGVSARLFETGLTLPSGSVLKDIHMKRIFNTMSDFIEQGRPR